MEFAAELYKRSEDGKISPEGLADLMIEYHKSCLEAARRDGDTSEIEVECLRVRWLMDMIDHMYFDALIINDDSDLLDLNAIIILDRAGSDLSSLSVTASDWLCFWFTTTRQHLVDIYTSHPKLSLEQLGLIIHDGMLADAVGSVLMRSMPFGMNSETYMMFFSFDSTDLQLASSYKRRRRINESSRQARNYPISNIPAHQSHDMGELLEDGIWKKLELDPYKDLGLIVRRLERDHLTDIATSSHCVMFQDELTFAKTTRTIAYLQSWSTSKKALQLQWEILDRRIQQQRRHEKVTLVGLGLQVVREHLRRGDMRFSDEVLRTTLPGGLVKQVYQER